MRSARRVDAVQSPVIPIVAELIRQSPGTISLGQGVVFYGPPPRAVERMQAFFASPDNNKYQPVHGIPELVSALAAKLSAENGIAVDETRRVVVTAGANMGFMNAVLAVCDAGDEVILPSPFYFNHEMAIDLAGARAVKVPTDERYQLDVPAIERAITPRTRAVVTVSPNNPTGAVYPEATLRAVNDLCRDRGVYHVADEAYEYFTYGSDVRHFSPASMPGSVPHTITLHSLSKAYGFASWRVGSMVVPAHLFESVRKIQDTILICPTVIAQHAAVGAIEAGRAYVTGHLAEIAATRRTFLDQMASLKGAVHVPPAEGALYFLIRAETELKPMELVERLIREHGVAVIPGGAFGATDGCTVRVSYGSLHRATAEQGIGRLVKGLREILGG